ncbi:MAG: universal stress protein, partial [Ktedonobacterales bacterium]|nr:universal stress protein [Ktedonobacterales bacterium]
MQILIPLDGSLRAETVLHPLNVLARRVQTPISVTLVMVQSAEAEIAHAEHYLAALQGSDELAHLTVRTQHLTGDPAQHICAVATEQRADLILMASHMTMLDPLTGASVAETVA